jgi:hypothetical protein
MLSKSEQKRFSEFEGLYDRIIPENNLLRQIYNLVDFGFVVDELRDKYCLDNGRNAESPIRLFKYLMLKCMYPMSDADLVERSMYDMSFKYFLEYLPEDEVISTSLLTKFRKLRLKDEGILDKLIKESIRIAIEQGVIKSNTIIVDSTHTLSRYNNRRPHEVLQEQAKALRKAVYQVDETMKEKFPTKITGNNIETHIEYCKQLVNVIETDERMQCYESVITASNYLQEMIDDNLEHLQTSADAGAKVGHKSADTEFFGFKTHLAMTEERIITAAVITSGEKHDGKQLIPLVEKSRAAGLDVKVAVGDGAYSEKDNIEYAKTNNIELVSRLSSMVVNGNRSKEDEFEYNKDADMFVCKAGHMSISKTKRHNKQEERKENPRMVYYFDIETCKHCQQREGCYKEGSKSKSYSVSLTSDVQQEHKEFQETERFKEFSKERYKIEAKNGELKNQMGYAEAYSSGEQGMKIQGAVTIFSANVKRILKLMFENK